MEQKHFTSMPRDLMWSMPLQEAAVAVRNQLEEDLANNWHCHPEMEIVYVKKGEGVCLIGDHSGRFNKGDIFLLGPYLPHCFHHEPVVLDETGMNNGTAICLKFLPGIMGGTFLNSPETASIRKLFQTACNGIRLTGSLGGEVAVLMEEIIAATPVKRLILLFTLLEHMAEGNVGELLSSNGYSNHVSIPDQSRISKVFDYTMNNYGDKISLESVAALVHMSPHSFCRFFKSRTRKSYFQFLTEVRVWNACRLLLEDDLTVSEISFMCGYNNISHFNHQFKQVMSKSPREYKKAFHREPASG